MKKAINIIGAAFFLVLFLYSLSFSDEKITITTYYPSPYGSYRELRADQMAIGSAYRSSALADGDLFVSGNVGIGTTSPSNAQGWNRVLDVNGAAHAKLLVTENTAGVKTGIFSHSNWGGGATGSIGTESNHPLRFLTNYSERMRIDTSGNVGIGTASPGAKLDVVGKIRMADGTQGADKVLTSDASGVGTWQDPSQVLQLQCTTVTCPAPDNAECTATCPAGYKLTGGGLYTSGQAEPPWIHSYPVFNGWRCGVEEQGGTCYAVCCKIGT